MLQFVATNIQKTPTKRTALFPFTDNLLMNNPKYANTGKWITKEQLPAQSNSPFWDAVGITHHNWYYLVLSRDSDETATVLATNWRTPPTSRPSPPCTASSSPQTPPRCAPTWRPLTALIGYRVPSASVSGRRGSRKPVSNRRW